jgi:maleate isomerase
MPDDDGLVEALTPILEGLRQATRSQRVTLRIDVPARGIHVDRALVEVRDPAVPAIQADTRLKQRQLATVRQLEATRDLLVQNDCRKDPIPPPPELMAVYGVRAQILAPLLGADQTLAGWISVHDTVAPRMWTPEDVAKVREITARVRGMLEDAGWL